MVAGFANSSFEILAGIGVFATLGYLATAAGVPVGEVASAGIGLAFVAFPAVISEMPLGGLFGVLFFSSLVIAGLSSLISIVQVVVSAVQDRTGMRRMPAVFGIGGLVALISILLFPTDDGLFLLDASDHFINQYGIALAALVALVVIAWMLRKLPELQQNADATSAIRLGHWWRICLGVITPLVLGWMMVDSLRTEFDENYEGYSTGFLLTAGWGVAIGALVIGIILTLLPWKAGGEDIDLDMETPADRKER
jgi:NSS family neurotransmitter:Na+ symporter